MATIRNILIVAQDGRLQYEALLFAASLRHFPENRDLRLVVAEPQPGPLWSGDPRISRPAIRRELRALGADIVPLHCKHFGARYPQGNKLEALALLPANEPFAFFDTDTLITGPIADVVAGPPTASQLVEPTWPREPLYGPSLAEIWGALFNRFGLDMTPTLDTRFRPDDWRRYLYFNAGWFTGDCPHQMGEHLLHYAQSLERDPPPELATQVLFPWLDQIVLPLVIAAEGGVRRETGLDAAKSLHYRALPEIYAFGSDHAVTVLETVTRAPHLWDIFNQYVSFRRMVFKENGRALRQIIAAKPKPLTYSARKAAIMNAGHWVR
ncbi:MAG: hypothetical protein JXQ79_03125 [Rhodobacteraceae bacterium]|nr:hypothetical protein [Paracoccaceae bacterium]